MPDGLVEIIGRAFIDIVSQFVSKYVLYPIGLLALKLITFGMYPPLSKQHNRTFVSVFGLAIILTSVTVIYS